MAAATGEFPDVLASEAASGDAALTEEDVLACLADGEDEPTLKAAHTSKQGADEQDDDWTFLLDALDAYDQPPSSGQSGPAAMAAGQQQQSAQSGPAPNSASVDGKDPLVAVLGGSDMALAGSAAAAGGGAGAMAVEALDPTGDSCSPLIPHTFSNQPKPGLHSTAIASAAFGAGTGLPAGSVTASGDADSHSVVAAAGWASTLPDRCVARFSWAEDNSPLLAAGDADLEALTALGGGTSLSPGSAGAHSSAGHSHRGAAGAANTGTSSHHHQQQQQQHQPAGSSSVAWGPGELLPLAGNHSSRPGGVMHQQHAPTFSGHTLSPRQDGFPSGPIMVSSSGITHHHQVAPQQLPLTSSSQQQYHIRPYQQPLDFMDAPTHGTMRSSPAQPRQAGPVVNQFAVPGSPLASSSPLADSSAGQQPPFVGDLGPFMMGSGPHYSHQDMAQHQPGRTILTAGVQHLQPGSRQPWGPVCHCCPPGQGHQAGLMTGPQPQLPQTHSLAGFSSSHNPDWRPSPHSTPLAHLDQDRGRQMPLDVPQFHHLAPPAGTRGPPGHQHHGHHGHLQHLGPLHPAPAMAGGSIMGGAASAAGSSVGGGMAGVRPVGNTAPAAPAAPAPLDLCEIHPAALSQFGLPEETFPVMVGPPKRKRGRPRKHPLPEVAAAAAAIAAARAPAAPAAAPAPGQPHGLIAGPGSVYGAPVGSAQHQHRMAFMQQQQQQQQQLLMQQHHRQLQLQQQQQQQQQQQHLVLKQSPATWASIAEPVRAAAGGGDVWGAVPDSPFSSQVALKRQKSMDFNWMGGN